MDAILLKVINISAYFLGGLFAIFLALDVFLKIKKCTNVYLFSAISKTSFFSFKSLIVFLFMSGKVLFDATSLAVFIITLGEVFSELRDFIFYIVDCYDNRKIDKIEDKLRKLNSKIKCCEICGTDKMQDQTLLDIKIEKTILLEKLKKLKGKPIVVNLEVERNNTRV